MIKVPETEWRSLKTAEMCVEIPRVTTNIVDWVKRNVDFKLLPRETVTIERQHPYPSCPESRPSPLNKVGTYNDGKTRRGVSYRASILFYWTRIVLELPNDWSRDWGLSLLGRLPPPVVSLEVVRRRPSPQSVESLELWRGQRGGHPREATHRLFLRCNVLRAQNIHHSTPERSQTVKLLPDYSMLISVPVVFTRLLESCTSGLSRELPIRLPSGPCYEF